MFTDRRWTKEEPGYTPAASPRLRRRLSPWPPAPAVVTSSGVAHPRVGQASTAPSPDPSGSSWWDILGGFTHRFLAYSFSSCSPGPPPSDGAGHAPALSGPLATLTGTSRIRLPPASPACCDRPAVAVSHPHSINQRLTAHTSVSPSRVLACHAQNQGFDVPVRGRTAVLRTGLLRPAAPQQITVPTRDRIWSDEQTQSSAASTSLIGGRPGRFG